MVADTRLVCGEGTLWHEGEQKLYWLDIPNGSIYRYDPRAGSHERVYSGEVIGGFTVQADGSLLLFMAKGAVLIWKQGQLSTLIEEIPEERDARFNDVIADPEGRVFCGTLSPSTPRRPGRLYRLERDGKIARVLEGIGISNGLGFSPDHKQLYYTDSAKGEIYVFDYERSSGAIRNQRVLVRVPASEGEPDGLTVDAEGFLWSARWNGSCIVRFSPEGREVLRVSLPARKVSCLTFGGKDHRDIYISTAGGDKREEEGPGAGALFCVNLGIAGRAEFCSRVLCG
ncbi:MAG: gluconolaconase [Spirochaetes bacterium RBG_16_67_19]|nr:MAG: gluconolaconase [Spirochaetes bacterium RBG_16_67_19]